MDIIALLDQHSFDDVVKIEEQDRQFLALQNLRYFLVNSYSIENCELGTIGDMGDFFLLLVVQNAMISYQIAGSGELRWEEFAQRLQSDFFVLWKEYIDGKPLYSWFYTLMITSKYNKRLYNMKLRRLEKLSNFAFDPMSSYYQNMELLQIHLAESVKTHKNNKTIPFSVKMFGYAARVVLEIFIPYPMSIGIPVDSRIRKIFLTFYGDISDTEIFEKSQLLAEKYKLPPLHLDSLLRVKR